MNIDKGLREKHFPSIEKKYGHPIAYWLKLIKEISEQKYPEQVAFLRENHGFSQAHANAVVMFIKGSKSSSKFNSTNDYFQSIDPKQAKTIKSIIKTIRTKYPKLELVIAWNQPMLRNEAGYIFGLGVAKNHILINPWSESALTSHGDKVKDLKVNKHTIAIPNDWKPDPKLLLALVKTRLAELK